MKVDLSQAAGRSMQRLRGRRVCPQAQQWQSSIASWCAALPETLEVGQLSVSLAIPQKELNTDYLAVSCHPAVRRNTRPVENVVSARFPKACLLEEKPCSGVCDLNLY